MTKSEFMRELTRLLSGLPAEERNDALQYYEDYFADAGITGEMPVPDSVGTPGQVADKIIREAVYGRQPYQNPEKIENVPAKKNERQERTRQNGEPYYRQKTDSGKGTYTDEKSTYYDSGNRYETSNSSGTSDSSADNTKSIVGIVLAVVTCPIWMSLIIAAGGILIGILAAICGVIFGLGVSGIALIIAAFLAGSIAAAVLIMGVGLLLLAIAVLLVIPLVMFCGQFLPWLVRKIIRLVQRLFGEKAYAR